MQRNLKQTGMNRPAPATGLVLACCVVFGAGIPGPGWANEAGVALTLGVGETVDHLLVISNVSRQVWQFDRALSSCECVTVDTFPDLVPPGASAEVVVNVAGKKVGRFNYGIDLVGTHATPRQSLSLPVAVHPADASSDRAMWTHGIQAREHALYLSASQAVGALHAGSHARVLDLRPLEAFRNHHIPGSQSMRAHVVTQLPYDPGQALLLVDEGFGSEATERVCRRLREEGHHTVHILRGGLASWIAIDGPLLCRTANRDRLAAMHAEAFVTQASHDDWRVISFAEHVGPAALHLPGDVAEVDMVAAVAGLLEREPRPVRLLIVDRTPWMAASRIHAVRQAGADVVFFLSEEPGRIGEAQRVQQRMRLAMKQTITTVSRSGTTRTGRGGCGGCP